MLKDPKTIVRSRTVVEFKVTNCGRKGVGG